MRTTLPRLGAALAAGAAILTLAACGGTSMPTAPAEAVPAMKATAAPAAAATAAVPTSVIVRGSVVDSSGKPLANIDIECPDEVVHCTQPDYQPSAQGHQHRIETTDAHGSYELVATDQSGGTASGFSMNANGPSYQVAWQQVRWPDRACTSDQPQCTITVNFRLTASLE